MTVTDTGRRDGPIITIGLPAYNNARTIARALDSLRNQTERRLQVIVSDDGSTDGTPDIVAKHAEADSRVRLIQQPRNLNYGNFRFLLGQSTTPFFMFAAGDDWWEPDFVQQCVDCLERNPDAAGAITRVMMHPDDEAPYLSLSTEEIRGDARTRVAGYLRDPKDNSRMYGVFRTSIAQRAFPRVDHHAYDWTFSVGTLLHGEHREVPVVGMHREVTPWERYSDYVRRDARNRLERLFPLGPMTQSLLFEYRIPLNASILRSLVFLNKRHHWLYVRRFHPRVKEFYAAVGRAWRSSKIPRVWAHVFPGKRH